MIRFSNAPSGRHFLQIPGPTNVPDRILRAIDHPTIDHRGPEFGALGRKVLSEASSRLQDQGRDVVIYPASGTGAWEAALVNTLSPGDRVLMFETGHFAALWRELAGGSASRSISLPATGAIGVDPAVIEARLTEDRRHAIKAVMVVHNETSTGVTSSHRRAFGRPSMRPGIRRCSWSIRFPRSPRSTTATMNGASMSPWRARRRA